MKVEQVFKDPKTGELVATVKWRKRRGEQTPRNTNYPVGALKIFDPEVLLDFYERKLTLVTSEPDDTIKP